MWPNSVQEIVPLAKSFHDLLEKATPVSRNARRRKSTAGRLTLRSLWLRRALRPSVVLPKTAIHFGSPASHSSGANILKAATVARNHRVDGGPADPSVCDPSHYAKSFRIEKSLRSAGHPLALRPRESRFMPTRSTRSRARRQLLSGSRSPPTKRDKPSIPFRFT